MNKGLFKEILTSEDAKLQGNQFYMNGSYAKAYKCYTKAIDLINIKTSKENVSVFHSNRATVSFFMKDYTSAIIDCEIAISINPSNLKSLYRKAFCLLRQNNISEATKIVDELMRKPELEITTIKDLIDELIELTEINEKSLKSK